MSNYYNRNNRRKRKNRREKIGFYTAMSICLIAVFMAIYSTYTTLSEPVNHTQISPTEIQQVNQNVTGIVATSPTLNISVTVPVPTTVTETETQPITTEPSETVDALQTMLSTEITLSYPLSTNKVIRPYTKDSVYFKTLNVWKPHLGVDFEGELGEDVSAMIGGAVTKVYDDKMYGKTLEVSVNNSTCIYSGLEGVKVQEGDIVKTGDKIGVVGTVPFEASDESHIHVAVKVDGNYADPLSFIGNEE